MKNLLASFLAALVSFPLVLTACGGNEGSGGNGGDGGGGGNGGQTSQGGQDPGNPADLVTACKSLCAAYAEVNCEKWIPQDTCELQCGAIPAQVDAECISETADYYACAGSIDYECNDGYPQPATQLDAIECLEEQAKANLCLQGKTCRDYCKSAAAAGCGGPSVAECAEACEDARQTAVYCYSEYEQLRVCETGHMACSGGEPAPVGCETEKNALITCIQTSPNSDPCDGYCWVAQDQGCDTGTLDECKTKCEAALSPQVDDAYGCSSETEALRQCEAGGLECQSGNPVATASCDAEKTQFAKCYSNYNECGAYCWDQNAKGCAQGGFDACVTACEQTMTDASYCDTYYGWYLTCQIENEISCTPGSTTCQSDKDSYDSCIANL